MQLWLRWGGFLLPVTASFAPAPYRPSHLLPGIRVDVIDTPEDARLEHFYSAYDDAFVLADEKETLLGFQACLALNEGEERRRLAAAFAPYRELVLVLTDEGSGEVAGGANFIVFAHRGAQPRLTVSLSYIFIARSHRRRGLFARLVSRIREDAASLFVWPDGATAKDILIFLEMNDPMRMSAQDYAADSAHAGLDQIDRLNIWHGFGARLIDMPYVQPPLSEDQEANDALLLGVVGAQGEGLDACELLQHMRCFFGVTVLKGIDPAQIPSAQAQLVRLESQCARGEQIALKNLGDFAAGLKKR
jgi:GNAT superfamily N-acetyltransferase